MDRGVRRDAGDYVGDRRRGGRRSRGWNRMVAGHRDQGSVGRGEAVPRPPRFRRPARAHARPATPPWRPPCHTTLCPTAIIQHGPSAGSVHGAGDRARFPVARRRSPQAAATADQAFRVAGDARHSGQYYLLLHPVGVMPERPSVVVTRRQRRPLSEAALREQFDVTLSPHDEADHERRICNGRSGRPMASCRR